MRKLGLEERRFGHVRHYHDNTVGAPRSSRIELRWTTNRATLRFFAKKGSSLANAPYHGSRLLNTGRCEETGAWLDSSSSQLDA